MRDEIWKPVISEFGDKKHVHIAWSFLVRVGYNGVWAVHTSIITDAWDAG